MCCCWDRHWVHQPRLYAYAANTVRGADLHRNGFMKTFWHHSIVVGFSIGSGTRSKHALAWAPRLLSQQNRTTVTGRIQHLAARFSVPLLQEQSKPSTKYLILEIFGRSTFRMSG